MSKRNVILIKASISLVALLIIVSIAISLLLRQELVCFFFDEGRTARICYEKLVYFNNAKKARSRFTEFAQKVENPEGSLDGLAYLSKKMQQGYKLSKVKKVFSWINEESLSYVIEDDMFYALLLEREKDNNYVLYYDANELKFYFDYNTPKNYLPVDVGWVNLRYKGGVEIHKKYFWQRYDNTQCLFKKANVFAHTQKIDYGGKGNNDFTCDFKEYKLIKRVDGWKVVRTAQVKHPQMKNILDDTMIFLNWIVE